MSGTGASNLGYGHISPESNINGNYVNIDNSQYPGGFGSNQIPGLPGLAGAKYNVTAAQGTVPDICIWKGGLKRKFKNITKLYKMKGGKKSIRKIKRKIRSGLGGSYKKKLGTIRKIKTHCRRSGCKNKKSHSHKRKYRHVLKGGYAQYQNNMPMTQTYAVGGVISSNELGLANPPPYQSLSNCTNCADNYNHYSGTNSASRGH